MLNIWSPRTKPLQVSRGKKQCFPSEHPLSPSSSSLDLHSPSTLEQLYFQAQNAHAGSGTRIYLCSATDPPQGRSASPEEQASPPTPPGAARQHPAGKQANAVCFSRARPRPP